MKLYAYVFQGQTYYPGPYRQLKLQFTRTSESIYLRGLARNLDSADPNSKGTFCLHFRCADPSSKSMFCVCKS